MKVETAAERHRIKGQRGREQCKRRTVLKEERMNGAAEGEHGPELCSNDVGINRDVLGKRGSR